jgi:hypothetical protein
MIRSVLTLSPNLTQVPPIKGLHPFAVRLNSTTNYSYGSVNRLRGAVKSREQVREIPCERD